MEDETLEQLVARLENISDANVNHIEIGRDRCGHWRAIIDEHLTDLYVDGRNESMRLAIIECLQKYNKVKPVLCQSCHVRPAAEPHTCPFAEEIANDSKSECTCCPVCTHECAMDI